MVFLIVFEKRRRAGRLFADVFSLFYSFQMCMLFPLLLNRGLICLSFFFFSIVWDSVDELLGKEPTVLKLFWRRSRG